MEGKLFLIYNAKIWKSGSEDNEWMVFDQDRGYIRELGRGQPPITKFSEDARRDYRGRRVFPGFHKAHIHVGSIGKAEIELNLTGCKSVQELQERLKTYVADHAKSSWVIGNGWEQSRIGRMPTKEDLDEICDDKPVFLFRACHHIGVANSKALTLAGINRDSVAAEGSSIDKYPKGHAKEGEPTGVLRENGAFDKVTAHMKYSSDDMKRGIKAATKILLSYGVTSAHSNDLTTWKEFCELADENELPIRIFQAAYFRGRHSDNFPTAGERRGPMLSCDRIKIFSDGSLGASTAALSIPYPGSKDKGLLIYSQEEMNSLVKEATGLGFRLEVHAIGDAGAEALLDALEAAHVAPQKRPLLTHCQILRKDLVERMRKQGVVANIQPQFLNTDCQWLEGLLPGELMEYAYAWKSLLKEGVVCSGGSDAPVEEPRPMLGIYDSIFRRVGPRSPDNKNIFRPEEALTVQEAVDMYTKGGAYATYMEHRLGQLAAGFQADFVVIEGQEDPVSHPELFATAKVGEVWVAGNQKM